MPNKRGRPPLPKKIVLAEVFSVRLVTGEAKEIHKAIESSGLTRSEWLRSALLKTSRETLEGENIGSAKARKAGGVVRPQHPHGSED
jgi:hypothetical protein